MIVSETGSEGAARAEWLRYVCRQCLAALAEGCELHGITLYPIVSHPGWADERHCQNGLWDYADSTGDRPTYRPLLDEIHRWQGILRRARAEVLDDADGAPRDLRA
jgi:hypothetical protein